MGTRAAEGLGRIEEELREERVCALRRIAERLEELLVRLHEEGAAARAAAGAERDARAAAYRAVRREARLHRWYLEVQREAMGLRSHERLDEFYPIPGPSPF